MKLSTVRVLYGFAIRQRIDDKSPASVLYSSSIRKVSFVTMNGSSAKLPKHWTVT